MQKYQQLVIVLGKKDITISLFPKAYQQVVITGNYKNSHSSLRRDERIKISASVQIQLTFVLLFIFDQKLTGILGKDDFIIVKIL